MKDTSKQAKCSRVISVRLQIYTRISIGQEVTILIITTPCSWPSLLCKFSIHVNKTRWKLTSFSFFNTFKLSVWWGNKQCILLTHVNITTSKHKQTHSTARILPVLDCDPVYTKCRRPIDQLSSRLLPRFIGQTETYFPPAILSLKGIIKCRPIQRLPRSFWIWERGDVKFYTTVRFKSQLHAPARVLVDT